MFKKMINTVVEGNCLKIMKNIPDNSIDLILTDPFYNVGKDYGKYKDKLKPKDYLRFIKLFVKYARDLSNNKLVIVLSSKMLRDWWDVIPDAKLIIVKIGAVYNKNIKNLHLQFHPVLTTIKSKISMPDLWEDIRWPEEGYFFNEKRYGHPAITPLKLMKRCVDLFSKKSDLVLDPLVGSGTTAVACKWLGRRYIGIEINPEYVKMSENRLRQTEESLF